MNERNLTSHHLDHYHSRPSRHRPSPRLLLGLPASTRAACASQDGCHRDLKLKSHHVPVLRILHQLRLIQIKLHRLQGSIWAWFWVSFWPFLLPLYSTPSFPATLASGCFSNTALIAPFAFLFLSGWNALPLDIYTADYRTWFSALFRC